MELYEDEAVNGECTMPLLTTKVCVDMNQISTKFIGIHCHQ